MLNNCTAVAHGNFRGAAGPLDCFASDMLDTDAQPYPSWFRTDDLLLFKVH